MLHSKDSTRSREKNILATAKYSLCHWSDLEMNKSYLPSNAGIYILIFLILLLLHFNISDTGIYFLNVLCSRFSFGFLMIHMLSFIPTMLILIPITTLLAIPTLWWHSSTTVGKETWEHLHQNLLCEIFKNPDDSNNMANLQHCCKLSEAPKLIFVLILLAPSMALITFLTLRQILLD